MPNAPQSQVSLLIQWPQGVPASPTPEQLMRRLAKDRLATTWAVEQASQVRALRALGGVPPLVETALLASSSASPPKPAAAGADWSASITRQVAELRAAGTTISTVQLAVSEEARGHERRLHAMGVNAVVSGPSSGGRVPLVRPLPFGLWQFSPQVQVPAQGLWQRLVSSARRKQLVRGENSAALATIDLAAIRPASGGAWRQVEDLLKQAAEASRAGSAAIVTIDEAVMRLAETNAPRPQRSILRAA